MKYADQEWKGSTDSSISDMEHLTPKSSISLNGDVFSQSFDSVTSQEVKMREKIIRLEMVIAHSFLPSGHVMVKPRRNNVTSTSVTSIQRCFNVV